MINIMIITSVILPTAQEVHVYPSTSMLVHVLNIFNESDIE